MSAPGTVYWITGLSGAGKTSVGRRLWLRLRKLGRPAVFLDGDEIREVFGNGLKHDQAARFQLAMRYARLCRLLSAQGLPVVCATISMFHEVRAWNRRQIPRYKEIWLRVPVEVLARRDRKGVYRRRKNVVGVHLAAQLPRAADVIIDNDGRSSVAAATDKIARALRIP